MKGVAIFISDTEFKVRNVISDKGGQHITVKESVLQEDKTILNKNAPNNRVSDYMREKFISLQKN